MVVLCKAQTQAARKYCEHKPGLELNATITKYLFWNWWRKLILSLVVNIFCMVVFLILYKYFISTRERVTKCWDTLHTFLFLKIFFNWCAVLIIFLTWETVGFSTSLNLQHSLNQDWDEMFLLTLLFAIFDE